MWYGACLSLKAMNCQSKSSKSNWVLPIVLALSFLGCRTFQSVGTMDENLREVSQYAEAMPRIEAEMSELLKYAASIPEMEKQLQEMQKAIADVHSMKNQFETMGLIPEQIEDMAQYASMFPRMIKNLDAMLVKAQKLDAIENEMAFMGQKIVQLDHIAQKAKSIDLKLDRLSALETQMVEVNQAMGTISGLVNFVKSKKTLLGAGLIGGLFLLGYVFLSMRSDQTIVNAIRESHESEIAPQPNSRERKSVGIGYVS